MNGHPPRKGKIDYAIGRHPTSRHLMSHVGFDGKPALSYYEVLAYYKDCSLISVRIITGRTHQIRVHCAAIGHKLLGDELYGCKSKLIKRPALHAWKISFEDREKQFDYFKQVPEDFAYLLKNTLKIVNSRN